MTDEAYKNKIMLDLLCRNQSVSFKAKMQYEPKSGKNASVHLHGMEK